MIIEIAGAAEVAVPCWPANVLLTKPDFVVGTLDVAASAPGRSGAEQKPMVGESESKVSNGDLYVDRGRRCVDAFTGGSGAGALGGLPTAAPLRIHGQRSAIVRFGGDCFESFCGLSVDAFGFSSSLELDTELLAPTTAPRGSLTLYPKIESPSMECCLVIFGMVFVGLGERDGVAGSTCGVR